MDTLEDIKKQEIDERSKPFIAVREFWTDYITKNGEMIAEDWVSWVKKGQSIQDEMRSKIKYMAKYYCLEWGYIEPFYKAWKANEDAPVDGTPISAWPGSNKQMVKVLGQVNIRSIDDFCDMEDSALAKLAMPGLRTKQRECRIFREAQKNAAPQAEKITKLEDENEVLRLQLAEMKQMVEGLAAQTEKRGPGRPRKEEAA